jgi:single-stranded DNA-binding protein
MKVLEYEDKDLKRKSRAVDVESVLEDMEFMEKFHGSNTSGMIAKHYFTLKRELLNALTVEIPKGK